MYFFKVLLVVSSAGLLGKVVLAKSVALTIYESCSSVHALQCCKSVIVGTGAGIAVATGCKKILTPSFKKCLLFQEYRLFPSLRSCGLDKARRETKRC